MNRYPLWKNLLLVILIIVGVLYALPNVFGDDPSLQISPNRSDVQIDNALVENFKSALKTADLTYKTMERNESLLLIRFFDMNAQLKAKDVLVKALADSGIDEGSYTVALNLAPATPKWLLAINATPMKLGLDLRGGVHFLLDVDINSVIKRRMEGMVKSIGEELRRERIRYIRIKTQQTDSIVLDFRNETMWSRAFRIVERDFANVVWTRVSENASYTIIGKLSPAMLNNIRQYTIDQTMTTLRNRVNELGVAEAVVQQQGANRVSVDLPGIQDSARAKQILGGTATLEFHLVDVENDPISAKLTGVVPLGTRLYDYLGQPMLLKNQVILSGDSITSASSGIGQDGRPQVSISLGGGGESLFNRVTRENVGKPLAIVYIETKTESKVINGEVVKKRRKVERLLSAPRINEALGRNFVITGVDAKEARDLALLLRAGSLPAAIDPIQERLVGPSLGQENIKKGMLSLEIGMMLVIILMMFYYRLFGFIADLALALNLIFLMAVLSLLGATLTLPGIAGIVLTVGMAVDANVLIFERIREELRNGVSVQASIHAGYERAFSTIIDANVTTLIVAIVLFSIGSGAVKGFAVTLTIGLLTSMLTAITFTRGLVNWIYGRRSTVKQLSIGL